MQALRWHGVHPRIVRAAHACLPAAAGHRQLVVLGLGVFVVSGTWGPTTAAVANLVPTAIHSTAMAVITLLNNLIGLAPGPFVTGLLVRPIRPRLRAAVDSAGQRHFGSALYLAYRHYDADALRKQAQA